MMPDQDARLMVYSTFSSLQGESTYAGLPCFFVRLAGCSLSCVYCDTRDAACAVGESMTIGEIVQKARESKINLVEVTGGEPLEQDAALPLLSALCDEGFKVLIETSGAKPIEKIDPRVTVVLDVKTPDSGMSERMLPGNRSKTIGCSREFKFVVLSRQDFDWAVELVAAERLCEIGPVLISPALGWTQPNEAAHWILETNLPLRLQLQLHKAVWPETRGER